MTDPVDLTGLPDPNVPRIRQFSYTSAVAGRLDGAQILALWDDGGLATGLLTLNPTTKTYTVTWCRVNQQTMRG